MTNEFSTPTPTNPNDPSDAAAIDAAAGEGMMPEVTPPTGAPLSPAEQLASPPQPELPSVETPAPAPAVEQTVAPTEVSSLPTPQITPEEEIARMDGEGGGQQQLPAA